MAAAKGMAGAQSTKPIPTFLVERAKKKGMRMTLHSNKLILPEHTANLSRERERQRERRKEGARNPGDSQRVVCREVEWLHTEEEGRWKSADHGFNFLSISTAPEGFSPLLLY